MTDNPGNRDELIGAVCLHCGEPLTPEQAELGAEMFMCPCGSAEIRTRYGDRLVELPDA